MKQCMINIGTGQTFRIREAKPPKSIDITQAVQQSEYFDISKCAFCFENLLQDLCVFVPCGHVFHRTCNEQYKKLDCPICRKQNQQVIPIHYQIEQNQIKLLKQQIQQNKQLYKEKLIKVQNKNLEFINNLKSILWKSKKQIDQYYYEIIWSNWNTQTENQKVKYLENFHNEISTILNDINCKIDKQKQSYQNDMSQKQLQCQTPQQNKHEKYENQYKRAQQDQLSCKNNNYFYDVKNEQFNQQQQPNSIKFQKIAQYRSYSLAKYD